MKSVIALVIVLAAAATGFGGDRRLPKAATVERCVGGSCAAPPAPVYSQPGVVCEGGVCRVGGVQQAQYAAPAAQQSFGGSGCQNGQCAPQRRSGPIRRLFGF